MAGAMLLVGLTGLLLGTAALMRDAAGRGYSPLWFLLPGVGLGYVQENWSEVGWAALLRVLGVALMLLGAGLMVARDPLLLSQPHRLFGATTPSTMAGSQRAELNTYVGSEEAILLAIRNDANPHLTGRVNGQPFQYQRVELVDGVLSAQQGEGFIPELEVRILLREDPLPVRERKTFYVRPGDEQVPEIHLSWLPPGQELPETRIITGGYRMELHLAPLDRYQLKGFLQLLLPDIERSFLSGEFIAHTNRLRYVDGQVDLRFDHPDTLTYLVDQYLANQFPPGMVRQMDVLGTTMRRREGTGTSHVRIALTNGRVEERTLHMERTDVGWVMRPGSVAVVVLEPGDTAAEVRVPQVRRPERRNDTPEAPAPITVEFAELGRYSGQQVTVLRQAAAPQQGIVRGLQRDRLVLETTLGSGTLEYFVDRHELHGLRLANGQQVLISDGAGPQQGDVAALQARGERPASATRDDAERAEPSPYAELVGRMVRITGQDGRSRSGVLSRVTAAHLTLEVPVGSGTLEYYYRPEEVAALEQVVRP